MIHAYDEYYLDMATENLGDAFEYAACQLKLSLDDFFNHFISCGIAEEFGKGNPVFMAGMSGAEMVQTVLKKVNLNIEMPYSAASLYKGCEYWCGWILAYYQWYSGRPFSNIGRFLSPSDVIAMYEPLHEAPESKFAQVADDIISKKPEPTRLQFFRKISGLSQSKLAYASGVSIRSIQMYEQRNKDINKAGLTTVLSLSRVLSCRIEDLIEY